MTAQLAFDKAWQFCERQPRNRAARAAVVIVERLLVLKRSDWILTNLLHVQQVSLTRTVHLPVVTTIDVLGTVVSLLYTIELSW